MTESPQTPDDPSGPMQAEPAPPELPTTLQPPAEAFLASNGDAPPLPPPSVAPPHTDGRAVAALVCAIGSWFLLPVVLAVVALVLAGRAERSIQADPSASGLGLVTGARWVAWIHLTLAAMVIAFLAAFTVAIWLGR